MTPLHANPLSRRRFLAISAAATLCPTGPARAVPSQVWTGRALGAGTRMQLVGVTNATAQHLFRAVEQELTRLEAIFSLYQGQSQLSQLNATGALTGPAPEMLEVLSHCSAVHDATQGAFNPTVQPLWSLYAQATQTGHPVTDHDLQRARHLIGWDKVQFGPQEVRLTTPGAALTLNGIAQGYITDRIHDMLRDAGLSDVMIDMGEIAAMGRRPDGTDWTAGIARPDGQIIARVRLRNRALATSAPAGLMLNPGRAQGHILDPRTPAEPIEKQLVSVSSPRAVIADALSTAGCLMGSSQFGEAVEVFPDSKIETLV